MIGADNRAWDAWPRFSDDPFVSTDALPYICDDPIWDRFSVRCGLGG
jgi:hypothetical protein